MKNIFKSVYRSLPNKIGLILLILIPQTVNAFFVGPITSSTQGSSTIKSSQVNTVNIIWGGTSDSTGSNFPGQAYSITSSEGRFFVGQNLIATNNRQVSDSLILGGINPFSIRETLRIPQRVVTAAQQSNSNTIQYVRTFFDSSGGTANTTIVGTINLQITSANSGTLSLSQINLRFNDNSISKVIRENETLSAFAEISHGGTGLFQAVWEIATPTSTAGTEVFQRIETIRQFLGAGRNIVIESPTLPTNLIGTYRLRLRITSPTNTLDDLTLSYSVIPSDKAKIDIKTILTESPKSNSAIDQDTLFSWRSIKEAHTYQIEIYEITHSELPSIGTQNYAQQNSENITRHFSSGVLLPNKTTSSTLSKLALKHLEKGKTYQWRTVAINKDGFIVAKSRFQIIQIK